MEKNNSTQDQGHSLFPLWINLDWSNVPEKCLKKHKMKYFKGYIISTCGFPLVASECLHFFHHSNVKQL